MVIRVDGHCEVARDYVSRCVRHLLEDGVDGVGGSLVTVGETQRAKAIAAAMSSPFGVGGAAFRTAGSVTMPADTVPFPAYTRSMIEAAGPYDERFTKNQDDEYNYRIRKLGGKLLLAADVHSRYYSRATLRVLGPPVLRLRPLQAVGLLEEPQADEAPPVHTSRVRGLLVDPCRYSASSGSGPAGPCWGSRRCTWRRRRPLRSARPRGPTGDISRCSRRPSPRCTSATERAFW